MKRMLALSIALILTMTFVLGCASSGATTITTAATTKAAGTTVAATTVAGTTAVVTTAGTTKATGTFKIGVHIPLTGPNAVQGKAGLNSIKLYAKRMNASGGVLGKQIEVISYDDQNSPEVAVTVATKLINVDKVDIAVNGIGSSCCLASGKLFNTAGIPTFGLGIAASFMSQGWAYQFRPNINSTVSLSTVPGTMKELGFNKVGMLTGQDDYGINCGKVIRANAPKANITIVSDQTMASGDTDFSGQISAILAGKPDVIFVGINSGDVATAVKQIRQFGWEGIIWYSENLQSTMIEVAGAAANHMMFAYPYVLYDDIASISDPQMKEFYQLYKTEYGVLPEGDCAYRGWDAITILDAAIKKGNSLDKTKIKDTILTLSGIDILGGMADFTLTKDGECITKFSTYVIVNGKNVSLDDWKKSADYTTFMKK
jgi:branched-chain amino acid transport system substrate-binding protein